MTIRSIGMAKLTAIMLVVLIAVVACSKSSSTDQPTPTQFVSNGGPVTTPTATVTPGDNGTPVSEVAATETAQAAVEEATGALFLEMTSPDSDEVYVSQNSYEFSGRTTVDALVSVNDTIVDVDEEGHFSMNMGLEEGPNVVEVVASDSTGDQYDKVLLVIYEPPA